MNTANIRKDLEKLYLELPEKIQAICQLTFGPTKTLREDIKCNMEEFLSYMTPFLTKLHESNIPDRRIIQLFHNIIKDNELMPTSLARLTESLNSEQIKQIPITPDRTT
jgi:hypothetical protein